MPTIPRDLPQTPENRPLAALVARLRRLSREEQKFYVTTLAEELGLNVHVEPDGALERVSVLGDEWLTAVSMAGQDRGRRGRVARLAGTTARELLDVLEVWVDEDGR